jgi:glycosyltransferase involved in cell wall biosynthesis
MKASVLINNYNYGKYLDECLLSVINQTYRYIEIILYDDGSTDNSLDIAKKYADKIKIIANPNYSKYGSFNQANAINKAFLESTGDIVFLLDSDDVFLPDKIEKALSVFKEDKTTIMVQHKMYEIDESGIRNGNLRHNLLFNIDILKAIQKLQRLEFFFMQTSSLSFRRSFLQKVLPLDETKYPYVWPDVRLTRIAPFYGNIKTIEEALGEYRIHEKNDSHKLKNPEFLNIALNEQYNYFNDYAISMKMKPLERKNNLVNKMLLIKRILLLPVSIKMKASFFRQYVYK